AKGAGLRSVDYAAARKALAKEAGIKVGDLEAFVRSERDRRHARVDVPVVDMHPEPVDDIAAVLDIACVELQKIVVADPHYWATSAMRGLHTHFVHHPTIDIEISPRLSIASPTPECGKTTLMEAVGELSHNPVESSSITASAFFRMQDAERCTLLIDEAQSI